MSYLHGIMLAIPSQFLVCFAADFICQQAEMLVASNERTLAIEDGAKGMEVPNEKEYDYRRTLIFSGVGGLVFGPASYSRYLVLDFFFPDGNGPAYVVMKTIASSIVYTPMMTAIGMSTNEYLSATGTWQSVLLRLKEEFWKILLAGYFFKVFTTLFCMSFTGTGTKFVVGQIVGMAQDIFSSWRIYAALPPTANVTVDTTELTKGEDTQHATAKGNAKEKVKTKAADNVEVSS